MRKVTRDFDQWFEEVGKLHEDSNQVFLDGLSACARANGASWWEWDKGSSIFFWRWPPDYQEAARVGIAPMFNSDPPSNQSRQPPYGDDEVKAKVKEKLQTVIDKGYIEMTELELVEAMMFMFHVPKGETDIRMVYDGSKSGLNESLYSPWFALPTVDTMVRWVVAGSWLADNDYGEQFLNFPLHPDLRKYCGVDLSQLFPDEDLVGADDIVVGAWMRNAMGLKSSPYNSVQGSLRAKRLVMGNPKDENNPFAWHSVRLNLPGTEGYDPTMPWIVKLRKDGLVASDIAQYVDDVRIIAATEELAWLCSSKMAKGLAWLGLQDAARKRRMPSQRPGAWAGATVSSDGSVVCKGVTKERWEKVQLRIRWLAKQIGLVDDITPNDFGEWSERADKAGVAAPGKIHFKTTESCVGFLVYVALTYTSMVPYLKGIYLSLNSWRQGRDSEGWATPKRKRDDNEEYVVNGNPPVWVNTVPRLVDDLKALMEMTIHKEPPRVPVRPTNSKATYVVGDASGCGFGSSSWKSGETNVEAVYGSWTSEVTNQSSSNFRETANLVMRLK